MSTTVDNSDANTVNNNNENNNNNQNSNIKWNILKLQYPKAGARAAMDPEVEIGLSDPFLVGISLGGFGVVALVVYWVVFRGSSKRSSFLTRQIGGRGVNGQTPAAAAAAAAAAGADVSTLNRAQRRARAKSVAASAAREEQQQQQQQQTTRQRQNVKAMEREELQYLQEQRRLEVEAMGGKNVLEEANKEERKQRQLAEEARRREEAERVERAKKLQEYREYFRWKYMMCDESNLLSLSLEELEADDDTTSMTVSQFIQLCEKQRLVEINDELCRKVSGKTSKEDVVNDDEKDVCTAEDLLHRIQQLIHEGRLTGILSSKKKDAGDDTKEVSPYFIYVSKKELKQFASTIIARQEDEDGSDGSLSDIRKILLETLVERGSGGDSVP